MINTYTIPTELLEDIAESAETEITDNESLCNALNVLLERADKQTAKRAVGTHYAKMRCPSCNHRIPSGGGSSSRRRDNWCNYCGQKIDWANGGKGRDIRIINAEDGTKKVITKVRYY